jgi:thioredoxin reductase (NADPH)
MKLPFIIIVDDDEQVLRAIQRDIRNKYHNEYRISALIQRMKPSNLSKS